MRSAVTLGLVGCMLLIGGSAVAKHRAKPTGVKRKAQISDKLTGFIRLVRRREGSGYARRVASRIRTAAERTGLSSYEVATTAYVESEFREKVGGGGMMQLTTGTYNYRHKKSGLKLRNAAHNVILGARELKYCRLASRGGSYGMWKRYNGAGWRAARYAKKSSLVYRRLTSWPLARIEKHLKCRGPLWKG